MHRGVTIWECYVYNRYPIYLHQIMLIPINCTVCNDIDAAHLMQY